MTIGEKIKQARIDKGLTQEELAEKLGYKSRSSVNKIETGGRDIPRSQIKRIAEILDVSPISLLGFEDEKPTEYTPTNKKPAMTSRQKKICELFVDLTTEQQDNIIGRAELMVEQNEEEYKKEDCG